MFGSSEPIPLVIDPTEVQIDGKSLSIKDLTPVSVMPWQPPGPRPGPGPTPPPPPPPPPTPETQPKGTVLNPPKPDEVEVDDDEEGGGGGGGGEGDPPDKSQGGGKGEDSEDGDPSDDQDSGDSEGAEGKGNPDLDPDGEEGDGEGKDSETGKSPSDSRIDKVVAASVGRLRKGGARSFVSESAYSFVAEAADDPISDEDIERTIATVDQALGTKLSSEEFDQAFDRVKKQLGSGQDGSDGSDGDQDGSEGSEGGTSSDQGGDGAGGGQGGGDPTDEGEGDSDPDLLNDTLRKIRDQLQAEQEARELDEDDNPGDNDGGADIDDPSLESALEQVANDAVNSAGEDEDLFSQLPTHSAPGDSPSFTALGRVMNTENIGEWKALLRKVLLQACGIREKFNAALPNKRNEGQLGGRQDVPAIRNVLVFLDHSPSMGEAKFKAVIKELEAMAKIYPYSAMFNQSNVYLVKWATRDWAFKKITGFKSMFSTFASMRVNGYSDPVEPWVAALKQMKGAKIDLHINMGDGAYSGWDPTSVLGQELISLWGKKRLRKKTMWVFPASKSDRSGIIRALTGGDWEQRSVVFKGSI